MALKLALDLDGVLGDTRRLWADWLDDAARRFRSIAELDLESLPADRARAAGLPAMHPHQLRHAFATSWLAEGGDENELMLVAGWKSRTMIDRYSTATAVERARASHARLSPADRR